MKKSIQYFLACCGIIVFALPCFASATTPKEEVVAVADGLEWVDPYTLKGPKHMVRGYLPKNSDGDINVVIEIPTGTNAKWEADKKTGELKWEFKKGIPRVVKYLGYPGNYGFVPRTILPHELGGDGDPLDVIVLGPAVPRGSVIPVRIIGVLRMLDGGEQDDKLIAIQFGTPMSKVASLKELDAMYPGVSKIVETWFGNYKGKNKMKILGYADTRVANKIVEAAIAAFKE